MTSPPTSGAAAAGLSLQPGRVRAVVAGLLVVQAVLLAAIACWNSPVYDEVGHLPSGVYIWETGRFDLYRVNPPLFRVAAALPAVLLGAKTDWSDWDRAPLKRNEYRVGPEFVESNGKASFRYFTLGRWMLIPLVLAGGYFCFRWANDLYGRASGLLALTLWCFSPNVLAMGATITADATAAALGVMAGYFFWRWLREPQWWHALLAGVTLGLAELGKMSWIILFGLWPLLWIAWRLSARQKRTLAVALAPGSAEGAPTLQRAPLVQLAFILFLGVYVLNLGYGFQGSFQRLGDYTFKSRILTGADDEDGFPIGNRFAETWLAPLPVPLPRDYATGIDLQKVDFEAGMRSYMRGSWEERGWWYYYLYAALVKVPHGTWLLALTAAWLSWRGRRGEAGGLGHGGSYSARWRNELILLAPAIALFALVSSQTGFTQYFRYVLPCFPFVFVWTGKAARSVALAEWKTAALTGLLLGWSVVSSLSVYPHSLSYFNELAGGPMNGHRHLTDSNIDWGQDLYYLRDWYRQHPEARPFHLACFTAVEPSLLGIESSPPPARSLGPRPGWHAVSVSELRAPSGRYAYFLEFQPVATAGYSIYIYHITLQEANRVRREMGLPEVEE